MTRLATLALILSALAPAAQARTLCFTVITGTADWGSYGTQHCTQIDRPRDPRPVRLR